MEILMLVLAVLLTVWIGLLYVRVPAPFGFALLFGRLFAGAFVPYLGVLAGAGVLVAWLLGAPVAALLFAVGALLAFVALQRIRAVRVDLIGLFARQGEERPQMLARPWLWRAPKPPQARWEQDVVFAQIPGTERNLLCDIWQPPVGVAPSGVAYIYLHGSAWYILDKDAYTRRLFSHLAAQGHVVIDVAYRLYPETDLGGMVGDAKRAIAWVKANAMRYGIDPARIVIGGSSAGGHMAQLVGFAPVHPDLTPADLAGVDLTVAGIISCYGPSDLVACFQHTNQHRIPRVGETEPDLKLLTSPAPKRMTKLFGPGFERLGYHKAAVAGRLDWLLGGRPDQVPERYALFSPVNHVHAGCPPLLLLQGEDDLITSAAATRLLAERLRAVGAPVANIIFPQTDHGFDLMPLGVAPTAQGALYATERFLAAVAVQGVQAERSAVS